MCIRDRASSVHYLLWVPVAALAVWLVIWRVGFEKMENVTGLVGLLPVSYTHLRAHETVLDLVCRLLLEKKNKNINDTAPST